MEQLPRAQSKHADMDSSPPLTVSQCTREFKRDKEESEMNRYVVGLDIAKQVFHLFMMLDGKAIKRKLKRSELLAFIAQLPPRACRRMCGIFQSPYG